MPTTSPVRYAAERLLLRLVLLALAVLFLTLAVPQLWSLLSPFIIALPVAAMLQPLIGFLHEKLHFRRGLATGLLVLLVCALAFVLIYWFVSFAVTQVVSAASNAPAIVGSVTRVLQTATDRILSAASTMPDTLSVSIRDSLNSAIKWLGDQATLYAGKLVNVAVSLAAGIPYALIYANFLVLGTYFVTERYGKLQAFWKKRRTQSPENGSVSMLRRSAGKGAIGYVRVQLLWFLIILVLSWAYFQFLGFQYAMLIAMLAALLELIPQFGCGTLYIPWSLVCFIIGEPRSGWLILGMYGAYSVLRRMLDPMLLGTNLGVSPLTSLIGMFVGMRLGGVLGLILGPIAMLVLVSAVRAHLFDATLRDLKAVVGYMKQRWRRGQEEPKNAGKR